MKSRTFILHNNNAKNLLTNVKQKNCSINNQVVFPFFISNAFIDFSEFMRIFSIFFTFFKIPFKKKNSGNF